jgi:antitoxin HicB
VEYTIILIPQEGGGFFVDVPALPHTFTQGETLDECVANAREVIQLVTETMRERGEPLPETATARHVLTVEVEG